MKQPLTKDQLNWIGNNLRIFVSSTTTSEADRLTVYSFYNHINGTTKKPNGCGRCWRNTTKAVYQQYMQQTKIY
jgi:hypothetical protein